MVDYGRSVNYEENGKMGEIWLDFQGKLVVKICENREGFKSR